MVLPAQNSILERWNSKSHGHLVLFILTLSLLNKISILDIFYLINKTLQNKLRGFCQLRAQKINCVMYLTKSESMIFIAF